MSEMIMDCQNPNLARAFEVNWYGVVAQWAKSPGEVYEDQYLKRVFTGYPSTTWNRVFLTQLTPENVEEKIKDTKEYFRLRKTPFSWWVGPTCKPADLGLHLEAQGLTHESKDHKDRPCMVVKLDSLKEDLRKPKGLEIELVEDIGTLNKWVLALVYGFGGKGINERISYWFEAESKIGFDPDPQRLRFLGYLDGKPVSTSLMYLGAGVAGIYCVATLLEARRKGIGTEMTLQPLLKAREMGLKIGVLGSTDIGYGVYRRIGFEERWTMGVYEWNKHN
jgi:ribosomal protein S18 acetylase RimI-like enzyme